MESNRQRAGEQMSFTATQMVVTAKEEDRTEGRGGGSHAFTHSTDTTEHLLRPKRQKSLCPAPASPLNFRLNLSHRVCCSYMVSQSSRPYGRCTIYISFRRHIQ